MLTRIAFRNIFRNRRRSAITLLVIIAGAVGIILFGGYKAHTIRALRESTIRGRIGHIQIYRLGYSKSESQKPLELAIDNAAEIRKEIERDKRVTMTAAQITLMGLISNGEKSETFIATAVEPEKDRQMGSQRLLAGTNLPDNEPDAVMLGRGLAASMNAKPGDYLTIMTTTVAGSLNAIDVRVAGVFTIGVKEFDDRAVKIPIKGAQMLLATNRVEKILVFLNDTDDTAAVHADLEKLFARKKWALEMKEWSELAGYYHQVAAFFNGIFGFIGFIVFVIVVFSVANTIMMSIFERTREIGTLMAIGTTRDRVWRMFLLEGLMIGAIGGVAGIGCGAAIAAVINHAGIMLPPPPGYTVGYPLNILMQPGITAASLVISVVTSTISAIFPAFKASRMRIVDALGHI